MHDPTNNWNRFIEDEDEYNEEFVMDEDVDELDLPGYISEDNVY